jgi:polyhydroxyalkanoate synthesis regulator protein
MLRKLLELPPARLKILRKTIERMEKYSEEDRELMRRKLSRFKAGAPDERKKFIEQIRRRHELLQSHLSKFSPKQKIEEAKKFHALSLNEKRKFFEDLNRTSEKRKKF